MRKVIVTEFLTLDGVMEAPHEWSFPYWNEQIGQYKQDELFASDAMLLGRVTYEAFASSWPGRTDETGFADRFNSMRKYVASNTLKEQDASWANSTVLSGDVAGAVSRLKQEPGMDIVIHGSGALVKSLMKAGLIDEYKLLVYPLLRGKGLKLFDEDSQSQLRLVDAKPFDSGVVALIYRAGEPTL